MGSLEFVSPDAYVVSAVLVKDPALIFDDLFALISRGSEGADRLREFQQRHGIDLRRDLAEPLGSEFLMALDGPIVPQPSWKIVAEVRDAPRIENSIRWIITGLNREAEISGLPPLISLTSETVDGRTFHSVVSKDGGMALHFTFWTGYMIVGPSRAVLMEAIKNHDAGNTLGRSATLRAQMPAENHDHYSALMYQNIQKAVSGVGDAMKTPFGGKMDDLAGSLTLDGMPALVAVYGEPDRILASARGSFGVNLAGMLGIQGLMLAGGIHGGQ
jgi:hypothetical protein